MVCQSRIFLSDMSSSICVTILCSENKKKHVIYASIKKTNIVKIYIQYTYIVGKYKIHLYEL